MTEGDRITLGPGWAVEYLGPDTEPDAPPPEDELLPVFQPMPPSSTAVDDEYTDTEIRFYDAPSTPRPRGAMAMFALAGAASVVFILWRRR